MFEDYVLDRPIAQELESHMSAFLTFPDSAKIPIFHEKKTPVSKKWVSRKKF